MRFLDEPTQVEARFDAEGVPVPHVFTWQGRRLKITGWGRQWEKEEADGLVRHFLVMVAGGDRFELTRHTATGQWRVVRAWERSLPV